MTSLLPEGSRPAMLKSKRICRFCMTQKEPLSNIYSKENRINCSAPLPLQVMACVSIEVFSNDGMPSTICDLCRLLMEHCYRFKQMCKKSDTTLRQFPLTGVWPTPLDLPKIPEELLKAQYADLKKRTTVVPLPLAPSPEEKPKVEIISVVTPSKTTPKPKLLNKNSVKILNKNADEASEPVLSNPVIKRDNAGNVEIVTEIINDSVRFEEPDPVKTAKPIETNVFPCAHCERSFPLRQLLDIHMVNHNRERSFECNICEKRFFSKYDLGKHMLIHTGEKPFQCVVCKKAFTRSTLLHRHEKVHTDQPKFLCVYCEKPFLSKDELEKHTERHKKKRPFSCKICGKSFAFKQGLERHETVHAKDQPFPCQYCEQSFSTPSKLSRHLTAHAGDRPFPCKLCPKSYLLSHHLTRHLRSHNQGTGSYKCYDCEKTFTTRDDLIYHSAVHVTETLICPLCKERFENLDVVAEHIKQHANGEQYACEFCDLIFMTADKLQTHCDASHVEELAAYEEHTKNNIIDVKRELSSSVQYDSSQDGQQEEGEVIQEFIIEEYHQDDYQGAGEASTGTILKQENDIILSREITISSAPSKKVNSPKVLNNVSALKPRNTPPRKAKETKADVIVQDEDFDEMEIETLEREEDVDSSYNEESDEEVDDPPPAKTLKMTRKTTATAAAPKQSVTVERLPAKQPVKVVPSTEKRKIPERHSEKKEIASPTATSAKLKQPTINSVLQQLPKTLTVVKKEKGVTEKKPETKDIRILNEKIVKKATETPKSSPDNTPRQTKAQAERKAAEQAKAKVTESPTNAAPSTSKPAEPERRTATRQLGEKKLVEMMIGERKVKVQKILMTKAEVAAMAKEGKIEMKGGNMILKQDGKTRTLAKASSVKSSK